MLERSFRMILLSAVLTLDKNYVLEVLVRDNLLNSYNVPVTIQTSLNASSHLYSQSILFAVHVNILT